MSFIPVISYIAGIFVFGFLYWILDSIQEAMQTYSSTGGVFDLMVYFWAGSLIVYLIFGGWYVVRLYNERNYYGGY